MVIKGTMVSNGKQAVPRLHTLDGLRGVAAVLVLLYHFGLRSNGMVPLGYLAVDLFFALSGFVITRSYEETLLNARTTSLLFMRNRYIRLYPLYALGLIIGLLGKSSRSVNSPGHDALSTAGIAIAFLLGTFVLPKPSHEGQIFPLNPPSWSLFIELMVNLFFASFLVRTSNRILLLIAGIALGSLALLQTAPYYLDLGWSTPTFFGGIARVMWSFPIGMVMYRMTRGLKPRTTWFALVPLLLVILVLCYRGSANQTALWELVDVAIVFPVILLAGIALEPPKVLIKMFSLVGDLSYPLYILHSPFTFAFVRVLHRTNMQPIGVGLLFAGAVGLLSALAARFYDRPLRSWMSQRLHSRYSAAQQVL